MIAPQPRPRLSLWPLLIVTIVLTSIKFLSVDNLKGHPATDLVVTIMIVVGWTALLSLYLWDQRNVAQLSCDPLLARLDRIAEAVERLATMSRVEIPKPDLSRVASAISEKQWDVAEALLDEHSENPDTASLAERLASAKGIAADELLGELAASQAANDPARVLEIRERLGDVRPSDSLRELDAQLAKWFIIPIMKRLRTGLVSTEVVELVGKVSERFAQTTEGASLRASLPTLRRSAGLCPRCALPYRGIDDACPACLTGSTALAVTEPATPDEEEPEEFGPPEELTFVDPHDPG